MTLFIYNDTSYNDTAYCLGLKVFLAGCGMVPYIITSIVIPIVVATLLDTLDHSTVHKFCRNFGFSCLEFFVCF